MAGCPRQPALKKRCDAILRGRDGVLLERTTGLQNNRLLAAMPPAALQLFSSELKEKSFNQGVLLQEAGEPIEHVYFPQSGMISLLVVTMDGGAIEAATIGREGAVGIHAGLGRRIAFTRAVAQISARCFYVPAERFRQAAEKSDIIGDIIARYTELLWAESQQITACNAKHSAEERLCRWLLQTRDRIGSDTVPLTQEFLSEMLGVRRTTVTLVARTLQGSGLIKYRRGLIHIEDSERLKQIACECYGVINQKSLPQRLTIDLFAV
jgi:CRP-like cAMP-binding protein